MKDEMVVLQAKVEDKIIKVYCRGKWRNIRYYPYQRVPSKKIQDEMRNTVWVNTGKIVEKESIRFFFSIPE